jgi:hypothetical protein
MLEIQLYVINKFRNIILYLKFTKILIIFNLIITA